MKMKGICNNRFLISFDRLSLLMVRTIFNENHFKRLRYLIKIKLKPLTILCVKINHERQKSINWQYVVYNN